MSWVAVDIETTGLTPGVHSIWEVALVWPDGRSCAWIIDDVKLSTAESSALAVSRFHDRWYSTGQSDRTSSQTVARHIARVTAGLHLVGVNVSFDARHLEHLMRQRNHAPGWHYHLVDVAAMALGFLHGRYAEAATRESSVRLTDAAALPYRSYELSRACGVEPPAEDQQHTALADAEWAARWYRRLTGADR